MDDLIENCESAANKVKSLAQFEEIRGTRNQEVIRVCIKRSFVKSKK